MDKFLAPSSNLPSVTLCFLSLLPHKSYHYFSRNSLSDWKPLINFVLSLHGNTVELKENVLHSGCLQEILVLHRESSTHLMATVSHLLKGDLPYIKQTCFQLSDILVNYTTWQISLYNVFWIILFPTEEQILSTWVTHLMGISNNPSLKRRDSNRTLL